MKRYLTLTLLTSLGLLSHGFAAEAPASIGIVNFTTCVTDSKLGKQEQASFEALKKQLGTLLEDTEKQLNELSAKFNDQEFMDGLSPEAEEELKAKFRGLSEEMNRYQNQYYQVLNQANMRIIQTLNANINTASENVAKEKRLSLIVNKEACFFFSPQLEITPLIIAEMDKTFDQNAKSQAAAAAAPVAAPADKNEEKVK